MPPPMLKDKLRIQKVFIDIQNGPKDLYQTISCILLLNPFYPVSLLIRKSVQITLEILSRVNTIL